MEELGLMEVRSELDADIIVYPGGPDLSPDIFGMDTHVDTLNYTPDRDLAEMAIFDNSKESQLHIGICRGAQMLNLLCGGSLFQDVDNHTKARHWTLDVLTHEFHLLNSRHHQTMIPGEEAEVLAVANASTRMSTCYTQYEPEEDSWCDVEALCYSNRNVFCFQGHPEDCEDTEKYFKELLKRKGFI